MKSFGPMTLIWAVSLVVPVAAQTAAAPAKPAAAPLSAPGVSVAVDHSQWIGNTLRLDGHVRVISANEMDAAADAIAVDVGDKKLKQVRALGNVRLKVDLPARSGGAPVHVESTSQSAILDPATSTLLLTGKVGGWFQPKDGQRVALGGEKVSVKFDKANVSVFAEGGAAPVAFSLALPDAGALAGIGTVTVNASQANLNQSAESTFTGKAHAFSGGARKFDVTADNFAVTRAADGTVDTFKTSGRTALVADLPPATPEAGSVGTPVRLEVTSDTAVVKHADNSLTFEGHVSGLYVLKSATGELTSYPFTGDRAVLTLVPATATAKADFSLDFSGAPTTMHAPLFDLGL